MHVDLLVVILHTKPLHHQYITLAVLSQNRHKPSGYSEERPRTCRRVIVSATLRFSSGDKCCASIRKCINAREPMDSDATIGPSPRSLSLWNCTPTANASGHRTAGYAYREMLTAIFCFSMYAALSTSLKVALIPKTLFTREVMSLKASHTP